MRALWRTDAHDPNPTLGGCARAGSASQLGVATAQHSRPAGICGRARNGAAADHVAHLEITAASRSETCEWLPPSGAAGSVRIAPAVLNEMQFSSFDVVQITIDIYMPWCAA